MTDKNKIKEEIERIEQVLDDFNKTHNNTIDSGIVTVKKNVCKHLKVFINSLPKEPASESLEKEITKCYNSRIDLMMSRKQFGELIYYFTEWQKQKNMQDFLEKACKWWNTVPDDTYGFNACKGFVERFKNYMQNEIQD